jgi:glycosyltransferase involved in cell wall biosynthesis
MEMIFHENELNERGTSVALYDYAYYCREFLNIKPLIVVPKSQKNLSIDKFKSQFEVIEYCEKKEIQNIIDSRNIENFYAIKFGLKDGIVFDNCRNLIHAVFYTSSDNYHGDVYAYVSKYMNLYKNNNIPYVPHMINLPEHKRNLRDELSIPKNAIVVGRHGGYDTFDLDFVCKIIQQIVEKKTNIYFLFLNTPKFTSHPKCIFLDYIIDLNKKVEFINTCDAMIHARSYGETFGLSVLEFACKNKQIISYDNDELQNSHHLGGRNHFIYLDENCFKYKNEDDLLNIFLSLEKENPFNTNYLNDIFSPEKVIEKFKKVFL